MPPVRQVLVLVLIVALAGCASRPVLRFAPEAVAELPTRSVFIATTRTVKDNGFGIGRSPVPIYLRYDLSVPPGRPKGDLASAESPLDPATQFIGKGREIYSAAADFRSELRAALMRRSAGNREAVIYVHGFNNTFDEGLLRIAQLTEDFEMPGVAVHYAWPSAASVFGYAYDRDSVLFARDGLDQLIDQVRAAGAQTVVIVAHSVGSQLVMETLRQRSLVRPGSVAKDVQGVVLISPDIDVQVFRSQALRIGELPSPFAIFVSQRDRALNLSALLTGQRDRLGTVDATKIADLEVTVIDVTNFSDGTDHFTAATSPTLLAIFDRAAAFNRAFRGDSAGRAGLLPGTVLRVRNATQVVLFPAAMRR
jgi:esterase/lipase superfamily enzyme